MLESVQGAGDRSVTQEKVQRGREQGQGSSLEPSVPIAEGRATPSHSYSSETSLVTLFLLFIYPSSVYKPLPISGSPQGCLMQKEIPRKPCGFLQSSVPLVGSADCFHGFEARQLPTIQWNSSRTNCIMISTTSPIPTGLPRPDSSQGRDWGMKVTGLRMMSLPFF